MDSAIDEDILEIIPRLPACRGCVLSYESLDVGLINNSWKVLANGSPVYLLQKLNDRVFHNLGAIDSNIRLLQDFAQSKLDGGKWTRKPFASLIEFPDGRTLLPSRPKSCYRAHEYVSGSTSIAAPTSLKTAYEAARCFGYFASFFSAFDCSLLQYTIPSFHDLQSKFNAFQDSCVNGLPDRICFSKGLIQEAQQYQSICERYQASIVDRLILPLRVVHHDAKISNMLFESDSETGVCVVDLDTIMPGYFISDLGDLLRTSLCECSEDEPDVDKIHVRMDYFEGVMRGYLEQFSSYLTDAEREMIVFSGEFIIFMQAIRFLTDYLLGDVYYITKHSLHNYHRARNQLQLLRSYTANKPAMQAIVDSILRPA